MKGRPIQHGSRGFTLVELLVASTVTVLVGGAAILVLGNVTGADRRIDGRQRVRAEARAAANAIAEALRNAQRPVGDEDEDEPELIGTDEWVDGLPRDRVRFWTIDWRPVREGEPESDVREVEFGVLDPQTGEPPSLARRLDPTRNAEPDEGGVIDRVARGVVGLNLTYHDGVEWVDEWIEGMGWPRAVKVEVLVMPAAGAGLSGAGGGPSGGGAGSGGGREVEPVVVSRLVALAHGYQAEEGLGGSAGFEAQPAPAPGGGER